MCFHQQMRLRGSVGTAMQIISGPKKRKVPNHLLPLWERIPIKLPNYSESLGKKILGNQEKQRFNSKRKALKNTNKDEFLSKTPLFKQKDDFLD